MPIRPYLAPIALSTALIGFTIYCVFRLGGGYETPIYQEADGPAQELAISKESPFTLHLPKTTTLPDGFVIYPFDEKSTHIPFRASLSDSSGAILATSYTQRSVYPRVGRPSTEIFLTHAVQKKKTPVTFSVSPQIHKNTLITKNKDEGERVGEKAVLVSFIQRRHISPETVWGMVIGCAVLLYFLLFPVVQQEKYGSWVLAHCIVIASAILMLYPYMHQGGNLGIDDWDYRFSLSHIYYETITKYHQLPLWNPYICGGTAALGDPEFSLFTPTFLFKLLSTGANETGASLVFGFIVTGIGVLHLARILKLPAYASLLSALIVITSSSLVLKATEGHTTIIYAFMWVPWILWAWIHAYRSNGSRSNKWALATGLFLVLALLHGGIYIISYTFLAWAALIVLSRAKKQALWVSTQAALWMVALGSFQLIPSVLWLQEFPDQAFVGSTFTYNALPEILFGRHTQGEFILRDQLSQWHEYGSYIGYGTLILAIIGASFLKSHKVVRVLVVGVLVTLFISSIGPLLQPILQIIPFIPRSNISRLTIFSVLCFGLLAGFGLKRLMQTLPKQYKIIPIVIAGCVAIDMLSLAYPIAQQAFVVPPLRQKIPHAAYPIAHTTETYPFNNKKIEVPRSYELLLQGYGTSSFCSVLGPNESVYTATPGDTFAPFLESENPAELHLTYWSPNYISFKYKTDQSTAVRLQTNYAKGWRSSGAPIIPTKSTLMVQTPSGSGSVTLTYRPRGMITGIIITILSLCAAVALLLQKRPVYSNHTIGSSIPGK